MSGYKKAYTLPVTGGNQSYTIESFFKDKTKPCDL